MIALGNPKVRLGGETKNKRWKRMRHGNLQTAYLGVRSASPKAHLLKIPVLGQLQFAKLSTSRLLHCEIWQTRKKLFHISKSSILLQSNSGTFPPLPSPALSHPHSSSTLSEYDQYTALPVATGPSERLPNARSWPAPRGAGMVSCRCFNSPNNITRPAYSPPIEGAKEAMGQNPQTEADVYATGDRIPRG